MACRRALVTGGAVRVGRAISVALGTAGYDVVIQFSSSESAAAEVSAEIQDLGQRAEVIHADLREPEAPARLLARAAEQLGGLDLLVNNAAVFPHARPEEVTQSDWDALFALNARAPFFCSVAAAALMEDDGGSIVNIADSGVDDAWPAYAPYLASKAALVSLTRSLARAWAPKIRVNAVAPGPVLLPDGSSSSERAAAAARTALGRIGRAEDVAGAVLYLDNARYVTGEVLFVDGGSRLL